jgi:hypothetical protein
MGVEALRNQEEPGASIEAHLAKIESAASLAIRKFAAAPIRTGAPLRTEITRFIAWQAARTPGWMELEQHWVNEIELTDTEVVEPPPEGIDGIGDRIRPMCLEHPDTGDRRKAISEDEVHALRKLGRKWILQRDDHLELLHMQAWYFQVRHFHRLSWVRLEPPDGEHFITSDRAAARLTDGYADTPPAALSHPAAQVVAPLTKKLALVGRHDTAALCVTPREVNRFIAFAASDWIAGPTVDVIRQALTDRHDPRH